MRLYVLDYGSLELDRGQVLTPGDGVGEWITIGVPGYLIQTDDGLNILVDTGMPLNFLEDPERAAKEVGYDVWMRGRASTDNRPAAQLAKIGVTPEEITHQVVTHTHFDHAGGLGDFPGAILVIQRAERELPNPVYPRFSWPQDVAYQTVDGDTDLCPGVRLLSTPGHTPGHMSVLVRLPKTGPVLLAIDALYLSDVLTLDNFKASWNEEVARASGRRVAELAEAERALLLFGHDPAQWATLRKAPAFYD